MTTADTLVADGRRALDTGQFREARARFSQAVLRRPDDREARFLLGVAQYHLGNVAEARRNFEPLSDGPPPLAGQPAALLVYLSRCAIGDDPEEAVRLATRATEKDPKDPRAFLALGHALRGRERLDEALKAYDRAWALEGGQLGTPALAFDPAQAPYARAVALVLLRRWPAALESADQAIARDSRHALAHYARGRILAHALGRPAEAVTSYRTAIEIDPETHGTGGDGAYYYNLALALSDLHRNDEAVPAIEAALKRSPQPGYRALLEQLQAGQPGRAAAAAAPAAQPAGGPAAWPAAAAPADPAAPLTFANVGGMRALKDEVRRIVELVHSRRDEAARYGIVRNGILLYGPPGCGKSFFARAIAGEFGLRFIPVPLGEVVTKYVGGAPGAIARVFLTAREQTPCLLFFDEFDAIASRRSELTNPGEQQAVDALLQQLDAARGVPGLVVAAATNRFEALDPAVIREGRFDYKVRVGRPDFDARREILLAILRGRPTEDIGDAAQLAHETEGLSAAQLRAIVDDAAVSALDESKPIAQRHVREAYHRFLLANRYGGARLTWSDLVLPAAVLKRLQFVERAIEHPGLARELGVEAPRGVLLYGPPGTGKTTIARVMASEIEASFFTVNPADVYTKWLGESEQRMQDLFARARDHVPAIVFLDEVDALLGTRGEAASGADRARQSVLTTFLTEMDGIEPATRVLVVAATNRPDLVDPAVVRPGRLSELIEIGLPDAAGRAALLAHFTRAMKLGADVDLARLAACTEGASGADLRGLTLAGGRYAFERELGEQDEERVVLDQDFARALAEWRERRPEARPRVGF